MSWTTRLSRGAAALALSFAALAAQSGPVFEHVRVRRQSF